MPQSNTKYHLNSYSYYYKTNLGFKKKDPRLNSRTFFVNNVPKQRVCDLNEEMGTALNVSCTALMDIHGYSIPFNFVLLGGLQFYFWI